MSVISPASSLPVRAALSSTSRRFRPPADFRHIVLVTLATYLGFGLQYGFNLIASRTLTPASYSVVAGLSSVLAVATTVFLGLDLALTHQTATVGNRRNIRSLRAFAIAGLLAAGGALGVAPVVTGQPFSAAGAAIAVAALGSALAAWSRSLHRGRQEFAKLSVRTMADRLLLLVVGAAAVTLFRSPAGALAGYVVACCAWVRLPRRREAGTIHSGMPLDAGAGSLMVAWTIVLAIAASSDIVILKAQLSAEVTGLYAVAALFGRAVYWGMFTIANTALPKFTAPRARCVLLQALGLALVLSLGALALVELWPTVIAVRFFGAGYAAAGAFLAPAIAYYAVVGFVAVLGTYTLSRGNHGLCTAWMLAVLAAPVTLAIVNGPIEWKLAVATGELVLASAVLAAVSFGTRMWRLPFTLSY
jgi:O-antigen/teichoic acid export membrane protein